MVIALFSSRGSPSAMPMADMKVLPAAVAASCGAIAWISFPGERAFLALPVAAALVSISICGRNVGISPSVGNTSAPVVCCLVMRFCTFYERC